MTEKTGMAGVPVASFISSPPLLSECSKELERLLNWPELEGDSDSSTTRLHRIHDITQIGREHWRDRVSHSRAEIKSKWPLMLRLAKVFVDPLRMKIMAECSIRELSPKGFYEEFGGGSIPRVSRAFDVLAEYDWLRETRTETGGKRRGAVEHFYCATETAMFEEGVWGDVPPAMKQAFTWRAFETYANQVKEAMEAGTIDARDDRHFTWTVFRLDQRGWDSVIAKVDALFYWLFEEQEEANARMAESGEEPIPMTVALAAFESPKDTEKQP